LTIFVDETKISIKNFSVKEGVNHFTKCRCTA